MDAMTTIIEYLRCKYKTDKPTTMPVLEAEVFGIAYPLPSGWRAMFGGKEVTPEMLEAIRARTSAAMSARATAIKRQPTPKTKKQKAKEARTKAKASAKAQEPANKPVNPRRATCAPLAHENAPKAALAHVVEGVDVRSTEFLRTWAWRELRYATIKRYGPICMCCGATAKTSGEPIQVDHIKPRSLFPELALDPENTQVMCGPCNQGKSNKDFTDWR